jgi:XTP/dITP diphosphohydrolase/tetrapyrrole methylase family protein/MazG family protein/ATP diphosphatase
VFEELGDVLFAAVNVARRLNVDPELALRATAKRFAARVERAEALAAADGRAFSELSLEEKDRYFDAAKEESS